jgi:hypothetical protein
MEKREHKNPKANQFFREGKELQARDVARSAHYTYRDGFRLGMGIFVGFLVGSLALVLVIYLLNLLLRVL